MKIRLLPVIAAVCCSLTSCFKDEPLNAECDIEQAYVSMDSPTDVFFAASDTLVNVLSDATDVVFEIKEGSDVSLMSPNFRLTEGATISPASGSTHDFSNGNVVSYTVTSQDGRWQKVYRVSFRAVYPVSEYNFENFRLTAGPNMGQIYEWSDLTETGEWAGNWATANGGFNISMGNAKPEEYPTTPLAEGHDGYGVKLETKSTGVFGQLVNMRLAAGNLFIGYFDVSQALTNTLHATCFGRTFNREPLRFTGWYKYRPGDVYQDKSGNAVSGKTDTGSIYAVLYRNHDADGNPVVLHGDDVMTNANITAIARLDEVQVTDEWTEFGVDFDYSTPIDHRLLADRGYNLAVVFSSSKDGDLFEGAIGSTLCVDEVKIICAETSE